MPGPLSDTHVLGPPAGTPPWSAPVGSALGHETGRVPAMGRPSRLGGGPRAVAVLQAPGLGTKCLAGGPAWAEAYGVGGATARRTFSPKMGQGVGCGLHGRLEGRNGRAGTCSCEVRRARDSDALERCDGAER